MNTQELNNLYKHFSHQLEKLSVQELRELGEVYGDVVFTTDHHDHDQWLKACLSDIPLETLLEKFPVE